MNRVTLGINDLRNGTKLAVLMELPFIKEEICMKNALASFALLFFSIPVSAGVMTYTQGGLNGNSFRDAYPTEGDRHVSSTYGITVNANFSAYASAEYGTLKVFASGDVSGSGSSNALAEAVAYDWFTLSNPDLNGTKGKITAMYSFEGSMFSYVDRTDLFLSTATANFVFNGSLFTSHTGGRVDISQSEASDWREDYHSYSIHIEDMNGYRYSNPTRFIYLTSEFIWGTPIGTYMSMTAKGNAPQNPYMQDTHAGFQVDSSHSAYWGGIHSVTVDGLEFTDYTITSDSGTDYRKSFVPQSTVTVPEPSSLFLFGLGLLGLLVRFRKLAAKYGVIDCPVRTIHRTSPSTKDRE